MSTHGGVRMPLVFSSVASRLFVALNEQRGKVKGRYYQRNASDNHCDNDRDGHPVTEHGVRFPFRLDVEKYNWPYQTMATINIPIRHY